MIMNNVLLISEKMLKSYGLINDNMDVCYLGPATVLAQEIGLQEILGTKLLKKVKELVQSGQIGQPENADYKELLDDYCVDYLIWKTMSEIQVPASFKTANAGTFQNSDAQKMTANIDDVQYLKEYYEDKARFYAKRLGDFLLINSHKYREWPGSFRDGIAGMTENYSGIYFRDRVYDKLHYGYDKNY